MRTLFIVFAGFLATVLGPTAARAATTTHQVVSGTGVGLNAGFTSADGCVQITLDIDAATSITRQNGGTSSGLDSSMFYYDFCNNIFEFGFTTIPLTNEFQTGSGNQSASLNVTFPIQTFGDDSHTRVVTANLQLQGTSDTISGASSSRFSGGNLRIVSSGHSVSRMANVTGQITVDGQPLLPDGSVVGTIETSMSVSVDITQ